MAVFIQFCLFLPLSLEVIIVALGYIYSAKMYREMKKKKSMTCIGQMFKATDLD